MILSELLTVVKFKIVEGSEFLWTCFGTNARNLDFSMSDDSQDSGSSCVFDFETQQVYMVEFWTNKNKFYRWINPDYIQAFKDECKEKNVSFKFFNNEKTNKWIILDNVSDVFRKVSQVIETGNCDDEVTIDLDLEEDLILKLSLMAHKRNITLNALMVEIIEDAVKRAEKILAEKQTNR